MAFIWIVILLIIFIVLFCREVRLDRKRFAKKQQSDNEHILREVERFLEERCSRSLE
jgi:uncharacterized membrane protein